MADDTDNESDITQGHPTTRHLRPADSPAPGAGGAMSGPYAATFPADAYLSYDVMSYGPDIPDDRTFRLLGNLGSLEGKRVLELGAGGGHAAIALAKQGAKVISVDPSMARLDHVRTACEREGVKIELHQSDLAELPFVRADTIDAVISIYALANVVDLDRVFRQVHRVLSPERNLIFSVPHPAFSLVEPESDDPLRIVHSYYDREARSWSAGNISGNEYPRTISDLVTSLSRAKFRVDTLLEPEPSSDGVHSQYFSVAMHWVPATLIIRARKEGI